MGWALLAAVMVVIAVASGRVAAAEHTERLRAIKSRSREIGEILDIADEPFPFGDSLEAVGNAMRIALPMDARLIAEAGSPRGLTEVQLRGLRIVLAIAVATIVLLASLLFGLAPQTFVVMVLGVFAGFFLPTPWLQALGKRRNERARSELPESLDLIAVMMHGGLSFERGLEEAAAAFPILGAEFRRVIQDLSMGATRQEALERLERRIPGAETSLFVSSVRQAMRLGTPLSPVLQGLADDVRRHRVETAKQKGAKAATLMAFPMALFILPAIFLLVGGPVFLRQM